MGRGGGKGGSKPLLESLGLLSLELHLQARGTMQLQRHSTQICHPQKPKTAGSQQWAMQGGGYALGRRLLPTCATPLLIKVDFLGLL